MKKATTRQNDEMLDLGVTCKDFEGFGGQECCPVAAGHCSGECEHCVENSYDRDSDYE